MMVDLLMGFMLYKFPIGLSLHSISVWMCVKERERERTESQLLQGEVRFQGDWLTSATRRQCVLLTVSLWPPQQAPCAVEQDTHARQHGTTPGG